MIVKMCVFNIFDMQPAAGEQTTLCTYTDPDFALSLLHSERSKFYFNFGLSECNRVKK